jgi:hypothetical protein
MRNSISEKLDEIEMKNSVTNQRQEQEREKQLNGSEP